MGSSDQNTWPKSNTLSIMACVNQRVWCEQNADYNLRFEGSGTAK